MSRSAEVVVLGAQGLLGRHLVFEMRDRGWSVIAQSGTHFSTLDDLGDFLDACGAKAIVNAIAYSGDDPARHYFVNGLLPRVLADWCWQRRAACVLLSTNAVFPASETHFWRIHERRLPATPYEVSKCAAEDPRSYVLRTSFVGLAAQGAGILNRLLQGEPYFNRRWNGVTVLAVAQRVAEILAAGHGPTRGLEHLHSPEPLDFTELAKMVGSRSPCLGNDGRTRLLAGGIPQPSFRDQMHAYRAFLTTHPELGVLPPSAAP